MKALLDSLMPDFYGLLFIGLVYAIVVWMLPKLRIGGVPICETEDRVHDVDH